VLRRLRVLLPPYSTTITVLALHYSLLRSGQKHHTRLYHGWPARVATRARCSLACPLRDMRISMLPLSHTQRSSAKLAASLNLPITNHCCRDWVREGSPLLVLLYSWRLLGASLDLAFARVIDIQCIRPRSPAYICSSIAHHRDYCRRRRRLFSRALTALRAPAL
jgi:hypothetical protein